MTTLRGVAHGIHSVTLAEGGLAEAVLALVAASGGGVDRRRAPAGPRDARGRGRHLPARRRQPPAAAAAGARLAIRAQGGELRAAIDVPGAELADALAHAGARLEALGGELTVDGGQVQARVPARR